MKAIIYESNTGSTKKYALLLAEKISLPAYTINEAKNHLSKHDDVIHIGWICAGCVKGYKKIKSLYNVLAVCVVGMAPFANEKYIRHIAETNKISNAQIFYMRGGFSMKKLHGIYKIMMIMMTSVVGFMIKNKKNKTEEEKQMLEVLQTQGDFVSEKNVTEIISWYSSQK